LYRNFLRRKGWGKEKENGLESSAPWFSPPVDETQTEYELAKLKNRKGKGLLMVKKISIIGGARVLEHVKRTVKS